MKKDLEKKSKSLAQSDKVPFFTPQKLILYVCVWGGCALWILLTSTFVPSPWKKTRTEQKVLQVAALVQSFKDKKKETPESLAFLRSFARDEGLTFEPYDAYGNRLEYLRLDPKHFLVRSFGADESQNRVGGPLDIGRILGGTFPLEATLKYPVDGLQDPGLYPAILLAGADSSDGTWHARLYIDRGLKKKHLVVREKKANGPFLIAPHQGIEEFLWVPGRRQIVYTITASSSTRDGVYLWDLTLDRTEHLMVDGQPPIANAPGALPQKLWLTLAGVSPHGPTVVGFAQSRHDGPLDARNFFKPSHLFAIPIPATSDLDRDPMRGKGESKPRSLSSLGGWTSVDAFVRRSNLSRTSVSGTPGLTIQKQFRSLPLHGELESILHAWNHFTERSVNYPMFPYALWVLTGLYAQGWDQLRPHSAEEADILRSFGTEIANALLNDPLAPSYLRSISLDAHHRLMAGRPLPYRFGDLAPVKSIVH